MHAEAKELLKTIQQIRHKLEILIEAKGTDDNEVIATSKELDELLNNYHSISGKNEYNTE